MGRPKNDYSLTLFPISKNPTSVEQVEALGFCEALGTSYYKAMMANYEKHVRACLAQGQKNLITPLERVAAEVIEARTEAARVSLLKPDEPVSREDRVIGFQRYPQYVTPTDLAA